LYTNSVFETQWWLDILAPDSWFEILIKDGEQIIARWPYVMRKNKILMPKLTPFIGYFIARDILKNDFNLNKEKEIIVELLSKLPYKKNIKIALNPCNKYFLPFSLNNFIVNPKITYRLTNLSDINIIYTKFSNMVKKNIKNAEKKLYLSIDGNIDDLVRLLKKTFKIQNRNSPLSSDLIETIYNTAKKHNSCRLIYAVDSKDNIHSGALFVYDLNVYYYLIGASDPEFRNSGANSLLIWEGIKHASQVSQIFDFEGSMVESIENFFRGFGGTPTVYYEIRKQCLFMEIFELLKPKMKKLLKYK
jgi:hypothetical protein